MTTKIAINGFGRIGRSVFRILSDRPEFSVVAINDLHGPEGLAYLLKYDTVMGTFAREVDFDETEEKHALFVDKKRVELLHVRNPAELPWGKLDVDIVIEATGMFRKREQIEPHLHAGASRVILTVPPKDSIDAMIVMGVNEDDLKADHKIVSNASCTTNCLAPVAMVLDDAFGIEKGFMTTVHAYTNDQRLADVPHQDFRRSRAAAENIIPTTTGAAIAVGKVLPRLVGKLDGIAARVPVSDGSVVDLILKLNKSPSAKSINNAVAEIAKGRLKGILQYTEVPLVSSDIIGNPHSCIFDAAITRELGDGYTRILAWYDNEWGYSNRVVDMITKLTTL